MSSQLLVSPEDQDLLRKKFTFNSDGYAVLVGKFVNNRSQLMHRFILGRMYPGIILDGIDCDHVNRIVTDNRRENLRLASRSENNMNRPKQKPSKNRPGTSKFKGVWWNKEKGKWDSQIKIYKRRICLGRFDNEVDAALAYDRAASEGYGEFAILNFPDAVYAARLS